MSNIKKNKNVKVKTKTGGEYSYTYTDLASINNYLETNNIKYYQYIESTEYGDYIMTVIIENGVKEEPRRGCKVISASTTSGGNPIQDYGAILTYSRRYSLLLALGLATDDNDANELTGGSYEVEDKKQIKTKEEAENYVLTFGKYSGKSLKQITEENGNYLDWLLENGRPEIKQIVSLLREQVTNETLDLTEEFMRLLIETETDLDELQEYFKVKSTADLTNIQLEEAIKIMNKKKGK